MSQTDFDRSRTLEELDGDVWGDPTYPSHVVTECHRLRKVPLDRLTAEDLRLMIGQNLGLTYLVPLALERLEGDPWTSGDLYKGDLLQSVLRVDPAFWRTRPDLVDCLQSIFSDLGQCLELLQTSLLPAWSKIYRALYDAAPP